MPFDSNPDSSPFTPPAPAVRHPKADLSFSERRREPRRPLFSQATLTVIDGPRAGAEYTVQTRDLSLSGVCFLLKDSLSVGQIVRVAYQGSPRLCEIIRSRLLSNGKHEIGAQFR